MSFEKPTMQLKGYTYKYRPCSMLSVLYFDFFNNAFWPRNIAFSSISPFIHSLVTTCTYTALSRLSEKAVSVVVMLSRLLLVLGDTVFFLKIIVSCNYAIIQNIHFVTDVHMCFYEKTLYLLDMQVPTTNIFQWFTIVELHPRLASCSFYLFHKMKTKNFACGLAIAGWNWQTILAIGFRHFFCVFLKDNIDP